MQSTLAFQRGEVQLTPVCPMGVAADKVETIAIGNNDGWLLVVGGTENKL